MSLSEIKSGRCGSLGYYVGYVSLPKPEGCTKHELVHQTKPENDMWDPFWILGMRSM